MIAIEVEPGLRVRFPGQCAAFSEGVAIGLLLAALGAGSRDIWQAIPAAALDQAEALADAFGYRLARLGEAAAGVRIHCTNRRARPRLFVVAEK